MSIASAGLTSRSHIPHILEFVEIQYCTACGRRDITFPSTSSFVSVSNQNQFDAGYRCDYTHTMGGTDPAVAHTRALIVREVMSQIAANYLAEHNVELTAQFLCVMRSLDDWIASLFSPGSEGGDDTHDTCLLCGSEASVGRFKDDRQRLHLLTAHLNMDKTLTPKMFDEVSYH